MKKYQCCLSAILIMVAAGPVLAQAETLPVSLTGAVDARPDAIKRAAPLAGVNLFGNREYEPEEIDYGVYFYLDIEHATSGTNDYYYMSPQVYTSPDSFSDVASPNWLSSGGWNNYYTARYATLQDLKDEIEDGDWHFTIHEDEGIDLEYTFTIDASALAVNDLPPTVILYPLEGATGVAIDTTFQWAGPTTFSSLFVNAYKDHSEIGSASLPATQTSWNYGGALPAGTNDFTAYYSINYTGLAISELSYGFYPTSTWEPVVSLVSRGSTRFVTVAGFVPLPVTLLSSTLSNNGFGLSFVTQAGATHTVQCTTNLVVGPWLPVTNFFGTGGLELLTLPNTNPTAFYRVDTQ